MNSDVFDKTLYADAHEIGLALGKSTRTAERMADDGNWSATTDVTSRGKHKKKWFEIAKLPEDIRYAVQLKRLNAATEQLHLDHQAALNGELDTGTAVLNPGALGSVLPDQPLSDVIPNKDDSDLSRYTARQRECHRAISIIMNWLNNHPSGKRAKALRELNEDYKNGMLSSALMDALKHCKQKSSGKAKSADILTESTVDKWRTRFKEQGHYIPLTRSKDLSLKPWHLDLIELLKNNRQKRCLTTIQEALQKKHPEINYYQMYRWIDQKYSRMDVITGQHTGMQLRARKAYQPRTADGLAPWQEVHADGWNTHFTAPHPVTGEFVSYEIWDFHDVATRYIPPLSIGLTESFEVIAKGVENAIRDHGVMCILQTDSTKIIKHNKKFTGDPIKSIADKAGITIVHSKTVGNAQANGIAENWHAWADKQCRVLATYQAKGQDSLTLRNVKKITAQMVKALDKGELEHAAKLKAQAEKVGGGLVFASYQEAVAWIEINLRQKWNNKPHSSLKKIRAPETGKLRHQTPQECLNEHKAAGWEPVWMDDALLADLFRVHVETKVTRGLVKPYTGMLFRAPELDAYDGETVIVAYDSMDYSQVWVKTLKGELICIAPFHAPTGYRSLTAYEAAEEKRAVAQIKNREKQIAQIEKRVGLDQTGHLIDGEVLERVPVIKSETVVPLMRVAVEADINDDAPPMSYQDTVRLLKQAGSL